MPTAREAVPAADVCSVSPVLPVAELGRFVLQAVGMVEVERWFAELTTKRSNEAPTPA